MVAEREVTCFDSMPNFRPVDKKVEQDDNNGKRIMLYRSSRPDFLEENELTRFTSLGIKTIVDFRSVTEYRKAKGHKLLDSHFKVYALSFPFSLAFRPGDQVQIKAVKLKNENEANSDNNGSKLPERKHILIDFFKRNYVWAVFSRAPWYIQLYSMLWLILDIICYTGFRWFVGIFARNVLNPAGLSGQYIDMINHSQASICATLKILSNPDNLPAMINCAHGKDRTGVVSGLVLSLLGRSKELIAQDYARSETELAPVKDRIYKEIVGRFQMCETFTKAMSETMINMLEYIDATWGNVPNYMEAIGFGREEQDQLKKILLGTSV